MTDPLTPPKRKNPILRTRQPILPPWTRSRVGLGLTAAAARGEFQLQHCAECQAVQYPPKEMCGECLSDDLHWAAVDGSGTLLSETLLHHAHDLYFRERMPWRLGLVQLDCGPSVVAHLHGTTADRIEYFKCGNEFTTTVDLDLEAAAGHFLHALGEVLDAHAEAREAGRPGCDTGPFERFCRRGCACRSFRLPLGAASKPRRDGQAADKFSSLHGEPDTETER